MIVCEKYGVHPARIFKLAYEYAEDYSHDHDMEEHFKTSCREDRDGNLKVWFVPKVVENFCLDILAGRIDPFKDYQNKPKK